jgi:hypothetical protein
LLQGSLLAQYRTSGYGPDKKYESRAIYTTQHP